MSADLVKRLRASDRGWPTMLSTAADRIEQLERELAEYKDVVDWHEIQLAAEKALSDSLSQELRVISGMDIMGASAVAFNAVTAYRKARGL